MLFQGRWDWAGQAAAADGGGGAGSAAGWRGQATVLILAIGAPACKPVGVASARTIGPSGESHVALRGGEWTWDSRPALRRAGV